MRLIYVIIKIIIIIGGRVSVKMDTAKILVVEDDEEINNLIHETLEKESYNITQAFDGREALKNMTIPLSLSY